MLTFPLQCNFPPLSMHITSWIVTEKSDYSEEIVRKKIELQVIFFCPPSAFSYKFLIFDDSGWIN